MSSELSLSASRIDHLSPSLKTQAEAYSTARAASGVDDETFDVAGARAALEQSSTGHANADRYKASRQGEFDVYRSTGVGPTLVYLHGGGFVGGSVQTHGHIALKIADQLGAPVCYPEYRLAPEHTFPAAFEDVDAALTGVSGPVLIAGDSVGATLAVHLAMRHPERRRIAALALLAPMLAFNTETSQYLRGYGRARAMIAQSVSSDDRDDPRLTPLAQDLSTLPPTLIQIGGADYVKADGLALANAAVSAGAPVMLEHWPHMPHVWHRYAPDAPEAARALARTAAFLSAHASKNTDEPTPEP